MGHDGHDRCLDWRTALVWILNLHNPHLVYLYVYISPRHLEILEITTLWKHSDFSQDLGWKASFFWKVDPPSSSSMSRVEWGTFADEPWPHLIAFQRTLTEMWERRKELSDMSQGRPRRRFQVGDGLVPERTSIARHCVQRVGQRSSNLATWPNSAARRASTTTETLGKPVFSAMAVFLAISCHLAYGMTHVSRKY